jgi:lipopolysaccharide/colanic/teichoic acid biosynthesis glycosyltransferase
LAIHRNAALQAVYSNSIGVLLVILTLPLLLLLCLFIRILLGPGPVIRRTPCLGFLDIPFDLLALRTTRLDDPLRATRFGDFLRTTRLYRLPQLWNVIRGELAICGPSPLSREYLNYFSRAIPFFRLRQTVKPGFWGWAHAHLPPAQWGLQPLELEYDLYYIENLSALLDITILLRAILPGHPRPVPLRAGTPPEPDLAEPQQRF